MKFLPLLPERMRNAERHGGTLKLHFNYHGQIDPEMVYRVLWGIRLRS